jgi:signal transduction histidine kinase/ActR/RegA family two-component response regulator
VRRDDASGDAPAQTKRRGTFWINLVLALVVCSAVVSAVVTVLLARERVLSNELENLENVNRLLTEHVQRVLFGADVLASSIEEHVAAAGVTSAGDLARYATARSTYDYLADLLEHAVDIEALTIADAKGTALVGTRSRPVPALELSDRSYFIALRDNPGANLFVSERLKSRATGQEIVVLARRLNAPDGRFLGIVHAVISASRFERLLRTVMHSDDTQVMLFRRDGVLLSRQPEVSGPVDASAALWRIAKAATLRSERALLRTRSLAPDQPPRLIAVENLRGYPLTLVTVNNEAAVLAEWWQLARLVFVIGAIAVLALIPLGIAFTRYTRAQERAAAAAYAANKAKSEFLSSMSHELRTPLNAIIGFAQLLQFNTREPLTPLQKSSVSDILKSGEHLLSLVNDVLDLTKIESGKVEVSIEDVRVPAIIRSCLPLVASIAASRRIDVSVADSVHHAPAVRADRMRFKQALLNLLSNAVKYNREGGSVMVDYSEAPHGWGRITVSDTGRGIAKDKQAKLFHAFDRLGAENSDVEGTGIGLVLCRELIEMMGGRIGFESEPGRGSRFWLELPLGTAGIAEATGPEDAAQPNLEATILYVEDNPTELRLMEGILSRFQGLTLLSAQTAERGIALARERRPHVIVLDVDVPERGGGLDALERLRSSEQTRDIPVLALSASATRGEAEVGQAAGFQRYLTKPLKLSELLEEIGKAVNGRR